jgi:cyclophilin family peptidyl-prolyl cis-trans isomerase
MPRRHRLTRSAPACLSGRFATFAVISLLLLAGCGSKDDPEANNPTVSVPTQDAEAAAADGDVSSGCWTAADRTSTETDGARPAQEQQWSKPPAMVIDVNKTYTATITTNKGAFTVEFYPQDAPQTVNNFICLARAGYFNQTPFHRILAGFVIQGGDPTGTGRGSPGYSFNDEPITREYEAGTLAMANSGPNTNGSQFFVVLEGGGSKLQKLYTIFGKVSQGMDVVNTIANTPTEANERGEQSVPAEPIVLESVEIAES